MLKEYNDKLNQQLEQIKGMNFEINNGEINIEEFMNKYNVIQDECENWKNNFNKIQNNHEILLKKNQEQRY